MTQLCITGKVNYVDAPLYDNPSVLHIRRLVLLLLPRAVPDQRHLQSCRISNVTVDTFMCIKNLVLSSSGGEKQEQKEEEKHQAVSHCLYFFLLVTKNTSKPPERCSTSTLPAPLISVAR